MNYETFCTHVKLRVQELKGEDVCVCIQKSLKNNGQELVSLVIKEKEAEVVPSLYLEGFYRQYECGMCFEEVLEKILATYEEYQWQENVDFSFFFQFEKVKSRIVYKLINQKENQKLLEKIPWFPVLDLALVFYCLLPEDFQIKASIPIDNSHLEIWGIQREELYEAAYINTPELLTFHIEPIRNVLERLIEESQGDLSGELLDEMEDNIMNLPDENAGMYVLSNCNRVFGAACILYPEVLRNFAKEMGMNLFVLPSSIHEVLLIPDHGSFSISEFQWLVREVNTTQVEREERLSDSVYYYRQETGRITLATEKK